MSLYGHELRFKPSPGERGTSEFLAMMSAFVEMSHRRGIAKAAARSIAAAAGPGSPAQLRGVYDYIARHVEFEPDPPFEDLVRDPDQLIDEIRRNGRTRGDCDDVATLGASLLWNLPTPHLPVFILTGRKPATYPDTGKVKLRHVFYGARLYQARTGFGATDGVVPYDPQERVSPGTWPREGVDRVEVYEIFSSAHSSR